MGHHLVLRVVAKLIIPLIMLFALYVQFHGDYGPGGGFQAGVIFASAFILHTLIFGFDDVLRVITPRSLRWLFSLGVLTYGGVGVATLLLGGRYLDYSVLLHDPTHGQHWGIFFIELGVGVTVFAVMLGIFLCFFNPNIE